jgi:phosphoribosylglycinamide formyltransferase 2
MEALDRIVAKHQPDFIVPEIEAIRTESFMNMKRKELLLFLRLKRQILQWIGKRFDLASKELD